jgi:hypothetical protein
VSRLDREGRKEKNHHAAHEHNEKTNLYSTPHKKIETGKLIQASMQRGSLHLSSCRPSNAEVVIPLYDESFRFPNIIMDVTDDAASSFQGGRNSPEQVFPADSIKVLPTTFVPGEWDVICQRGRQNYYHSKYYDMEAT